MSRDCIGLGFPIKGRHSWQGSSRLSGDNEPIRKQEERVTCNWVGAHTDTKLHLGSVFDGGVSSLSKGHSFIGKCRYHIAGTKRDREGLWGVWLSVHSYRRQEEKG